MLQVSSKSLPAPMLNVQPARIKSANDLGDLYYKNIVDSKLTAFSLEHVDGNRRTYQVIWENGKVSSVKRDKTNLTREQRVSEYWKNGLFEHSIAQQIMKRLSHFQPTTPPNTPQNSEDSRLAKNVGERVHHERASRQPKEIVSAENTRALENRLGVPNQPQSKINEQINAIEDVRAQIESRKKSVLANIDAALKNNDHLPESYGLSTKADEAQATIKQVCEHLETELKEIARSYSNSIANSIGHNDPLISAADWVIEQTKATAAHLNDSLKKFLGEAKGIEESFLLEVEKAQQIEKLTGIETKIKEMGTGRIFQSDFVRETDEIKQQTGEAETQLNEVMNPLLNALSEVRHCAAHPISRTNIDALKNSIGNLDASLCLSEEKANQIEDTFTSKTFFALQNYTIIKLHKINLQINQLGDRAKRDMGNALQHNRSTNGGDEILTQEAAQATAAVNASIDSLRRKQRALSREAQENTDAHNIKQRASSMRELELSLATAAKEINTIASTFANKIICLGMQIRIRNEITVFLNDNRNILGHRGIINPGAEDQNRINYYNQDTQDMISYLTWFEDAFNTPNSFFMEVGDLTSIENTINTYKKMIREFTDLANMPRSFKDKVIGDDQFRFPHCPLPSPLKKLQELQPQIQPLVNLFRAEIGILNSELLSEINSTLSSISNESSDFFRLDINNKLFQVESELHILMMQFIDLEVFSGDLKVSITDGSKPAKSFNAEVESTNKKLDTIKHTINKQRDAISEINSTLAAYLPRKEMANKITAFLEREDIKEITSKDQPLIGKLREIKYLLLNPRENLIISLATLDSNVVEASMKVLEEWVSKKNQPTDTQINHSFGNPFASSNPFDTPLPEIPNPETPEIPAFTQRDEFDPRSYNKRIDAYIERLNFEQKLMLVSQYKNVSKIPSVFEQQTKLDQQKPTFDESTFTINGIKRIRTENTEKTMAMRIKSILKHRNLTYVLREIKSHKEAVLEEMDLRREALDVLEDHSLDIWQSSAKFKYKSKLLKRSTEFFGSLHDVFDVLRRLVGIPTLEDEYHDELRKIQTSRNNKEERVNRPKKTIEEVMQSLGNRKREQEDESQNLMMQMFQYIQSAIPPLADNK